MSVGFLTANVWLDDDGRHLWLRHDCTDGENVTWLPSTWKADAEGNVTPSIHCTVCGLHYFARVEPRPEFVLARDKEDRQ